MAHMDMELLVYEGVNGASVAVRRGVADGAVHLAIDIALPLGAADLSGAAAAAPGASAGVGGDDGAGFFAGLAPAVAGEGPGPGDALDGAEGAPPALAGPASADAGPAGHGGAAVDGAAPAPADGGAAVPVPAPPSRRRWRADLFPGSGAGGAGGGDGVAGGGDVGAGAAGGRAAVAVGPPVRSTSTRSEWAGGAAAVFFFRQQRRRISRAVQCPVQERVRGRLMVWRMRSSSAYQRQSASLTGTRGGGGGAPLIAPTDFLVSGGG